MIAVVGGAARVLKQQTLETAIVRVAQRGMHTHVRCHAYKWMSKTRVKLDE